MIGAATKYAVRSLGRNRRRTWLSVIGIGVGCALALTMESMNRGRAELFARMGSSAGAGHVRVVARGWTERRDPRLRLANWQADLAEVRAQPDIAAVTVRSRAQALVAMGTHVVPVEIVGVDPQAEPAANRFVRTVSRGRYLQTGDAGAVVIGKALADRLTAEVDDEILATAVGKSGDIESAMLHVVGIVATGSEDLDITICQTTLADVQRITGLAPVGEIAATLRDWRRTDAVKAALVPRIAGGDEVLTWGEIMPEFKGHMEQDTAASRVVTMIILLIVFLGVASAQLAAVLERRREFAVLSAIGVRRATMTTILLEEAFAVGLAGGLLGLAIGLPVIWKFARNGLDLTAYMGTGYSFQGVVLEPIIYGDFGWWAGWYVFTVAIVATVLASLYPAWFAARTDPADALRVA